MPGTRRHVGSCPGTRTAAWAHVRACALLRGVLAGPAGGGLPRVHPPLPVQGQRAVQAAARTQLNPPGPGPAWLLRYAVPPLQAERVEVHARACTRVCMCVCVHVVACGCAAARCSHAVRYMPLHAVRFMLHAACWMLWDTYGVCVCVCAWACNHELLCTCMQVSVRACVESTRCFLTAAVGACCPATIMQAFHGTWTLAVCCIALSCRGLKSMQIYTYKSTHRHTRTLTSTHSCKQAHTSTHICTRAHTHIHMLC